MNRRTQISTIVAIVAYVNMVLAVMDVSAFDGHPKALFAYKVLAALFAAIAWVNSHYFNQDFTQIANEHTGRMRQEKLEAQEDYIGERFFDEGLEEVEPVTADTDEEDDDTEEGGEDE